MLNRFRSALLAGFAGLSVLAGAIAPAAAVGPIQSSIQVYPQWNTYNATIAALTPASSATDFFTLTGSATKVIYVRSIGCTGTSTTVASQIVSAMVRSTADTLGTSTGSPAAVPLDSNFPAATATVLAYTANPTTGTLVGNVGSGLLQTPAPASIAAGNGLYFNFLQVNGDQPIVLRGTSQVLALNAGGSSFSSGAALTCSVTWTERSS